MIILQLLDMELKDILQRFLEHYESLLKLIHEESEDAHHDPDNDMLNMEYNVSTLVLLF